MIGSLVNSGDLSSEILLDYYKDKPYFEGIKNNVETVTNPHDLSVFSMEYLHAHFVASQTIVQREVHRELMLFDNGRHIPDDLLHSFIAMLNRVKIINWVNSGYYFRHVGPHRGDFTEEELETIERECKEWMVDRDITPDFNERPYEIIHN